jgi:hypothetical protein
MTSQMNGNWSNRKRTITIGGTLTALASIVTIVSFFNSHSSPPTPTAPPTYQPTSSQSTGPAPTTTPVYTGNVADSYLSNCEQNSGPSFCQCTLNWLEAHVSQSQFVQDMAGLNQYEQGVTSDPPPDVTKAYVACSTNGS